MPMTRSTLVPLLIGLVTCSACATTQARPGEVPSASGTPERTENSPSASLHGPQLTLTLEHRRIGDAFEDDDEVPRTRLTLLEGAPEAPTRTTLVGDVTGNCGDHGYIDDPNHTLLHLVCWHAGGGREVAITRQGDEVRVETRMIWEEDEEGTPWELKRTIRLPEGAELDVRALHVP
jgi:hypothetical protein